eukprot:CAMPEP_0117651148 /NCGR_PEP_ID=MMETSP0804-20121206/1935_1 /TAXON_ID=1074897 /ORGANISM="Tetraselmis astigmatica, Strain CCMP880" /LENGTH=36 /DNA_ID= /DNA_START= /DNA_END= /DNA_ORIENTATION=
MGAVMGGTCRRSMDSPLTRAPALQMATKKLIAENKK